MLGHSRAHMLPGLYGTIAVVTFIIGLELVPWWGAAIMAVAGVGFGVLLQPLGVVQLKKALKREGTDE